MTGRPSAFLSADSTVPLPRPIEEEFFFVRGNVAFENWEGQLEPHYLGQESPYIYDTLPHQSSSSPTQMHASPTQAFQPTFPPTPIPPSHALYFLLQTQLGLITNEVLDQLYRPKVVKRSWEHVQLVISALGAKLEQWQTSLPPIFDFTKRQRDQQFTRQRMCLGLFFYSTAMIVSRPCLCRMARTEPAGSEEFREFNRATAANCVHAAKAMLDLLPDEPNPVGLYKVAPWWCLVHHLVQASTVSMLELSFQADHVPEEVDKILQSAKKAVRWLRSMAVEDLAASRAWRLSEEMLHKVASRVGKPLDGFPEGDLPEGGGGGGSLSDYAYSTPRAGPEGAANMEGISGPRHPSDGSSQPAPFRGEWPLQAQIYTAYDEIFPRYLRAPVAMTIAEPSSDFLSMYPSPSQMEGFLSGDLDDLSMTDYDHGGS